MRLGSLEALAKVPSLRRLRLGLAPGVQLSASVDCLGLARAQGVTSLQLHLLQQDLSDRWAAQLRLRGPVAAAVMAARLLGRWGSGDGARGLWSDH
jgi:hypothetical protein